MNNTAFQDRVENTLAAIVESLSSFQKSMEERMDKLEERMDRLEERMYGLEERMVRLVERMDGLELVVERVRIEAAEDRLKTSTIQTAIRKSVRELSVV